MDEVIPIPKSEECENENGKSREPNTLTGHLDYFSLHSVI